MFTILKQKNLRIYLFLWHLFLSCAIAMGVSVLVFWLWFPYPYQEMTRGLNLFLLIICVDIVCGPLITLMLANPKKSKRELILDLTLVALIQFCALAYGIHTLEQARPVLVSFERDRMALIIKSEIDWKDLPNAPKELQQIPWAGVNKIGIRRAANEKEFFESVNLGMKGIEPSVRPSWWVAYDTVIPEVKEKMLPIKEIDLLKLPQSDVQKLEHAITKTTLTKDDLFYLPFVSTYNTKWIVLMDSNANFVGYAPIDGLDLYNK